MSKYIVTVENQYTRVGKLARLNYNGTYYEEIATGAYSEMLELAKILNDRATK